jgi:diamine N-acetyltransferase
MPKPFVSPLENGRILLRLVEESDLPMTLIWRNQDHIRKWFIHSEVLSPEQHQTWFKDYLTRENDYVFIIEENENLKKPIGQISLYNIDRDLKFAEYGRLMIGEAEAQGKGLAKEATRLLLGYAFKELGLTRVELEVLEDNKPAMAVYRACGFQEISGYDGLKKLTIEVSTFNSELE